MPFLPERISSGKIFETIPILCLGVSLCLLICAGKSLHVCACVFVYYTHVKVEKKKKKMHGSCIQQTSHQFDVLSVHGGQNLYLL